MSSLVVDTHAAIWYLQKSPRLSSTACAALDQVTGMDNICLSSISMVEIIYLAEKGRISQIAVDRLFDVVSNPATGWVLVPLDLGIVQTMSSVPRDAIPDMPDRIIAATALHLALPLVTRDGKISASGLTTIW